MKYTYNLKISVLKKNDLLTIVSKKLRINNFKCDILRESIDARNKNDIYYNYELLIETEKKVNNKDLKPYVERYIDPIYHEYQENDRPIIVGFGPAGMFAALYLARAKANPIIIERGSKVEERTKQVEDFFKNKKLLKNSNVVFGEGGAGTFSDGKLQSNVKNEWNQFVLRELVKHGASKEILISNYPHVGTDVLVDVVKSIREEIISLGGEFYFDTCLTDIKILANEVEIKTEGSNELNLKTKHLILGIGHSAKDTFMMLREKGILMEQKAFSMGVRIEHLASDINYMQYGRFADVLPPAPYKLAVHLKERSVYSFCMCPGGVVVASQNNEETIVTNGMSYSKRDGINSNSALLVEVRPTDYNQGDLFDGFKFQEKYEKLAYLVSSDYRAPASLVKDFLEDKISKEFKSVKTTYPHGVVFTDFKKCLPLFVVDSLKEALPLFNRKIEGFNNPEAVLVGVETRSSSPVRIVRDENYQANKYIYPIGEGAGYAGGIMSAALDGLKIALSIVEK